MPKEVPSLVTIAQQVLSRNLDAITDVGEVPYSLLKEPLSKATPKQLYRIERANPHLMPGSDELWLQHCLTFLDLREAYERGEHRDPKCWRGLYLKRFGENEKKQKLVAAKIKEQYNKIESQKAARSIKILTGKVPLPRRRGASSSETSGRSKLFQETKKAADRTRAMYQRVPTARVPPVPSPVVSAKQRTAQRLERRQTTVPSSTKPPTKSLPQSTPPQRNMSFPPPKRNLPPAVVPAPSSRYSNDKPLPSIYAPRRPPPQSNIYAPVSKRRKLVTQPPPSQEQRTLVRSTSTTSMDQADSNPSIKKPMAKVNYNIFKDLSR